MSNLWFFRLKRAEQQRRRSSGEQSVGSASIQSVSGCCSAASLAPSVGGGPGSGTPEQTGLGFARAGGGQAGPATTAAPGDRSYHHHHQQRHNHRACRHCRGCGLKHDERDFSHGRCGAAAADDDEHDDSDASDDDDRAQEGASVGATAADTGADVANNDYDESGDDESDDLERLAAGRRVSGQRERTPAGERAELDAASGNNDNNNNNAKSRPRRHGPASATGAGHWDVSAWQEVRQTIPSEIMAPVGGQKGPPEVATRQQQQFHHHQPASGQRHKTKQQPQQKPQAGSWRVASAKSNASQLERPQLPQVTIIRSDSNSSSFIAMGEQQQRWRAGQQSGPPGGWAPTGGRVRGAKCELVSRLLDESSGLVETNLNDAGRSSVVCPTARSKVEVYGDDGDQLAGRPHGRDSASSHRLLSSGQVPPIRDKSLLDPEGGEAHQGLPLADSMDNLAALIPR
jgi:hypothetical protein